MSESRKYKVIKPFRVGGKLLKVDSTTTSEKITASEARGLIAQGKLELIKVEPSKDKSGDDDAGSSKDKA